MLSEENEFDINDSPKCCQRRISLISITPQSGIRGEWVWYQWLLKSVIRGEWVWYQWLPKVLSEENKFDINNSSKCYRRRMSLISMTPKVLSEENKFDINNSPKCYQKRMNLSNWQHANTGSDNGLHWIGNKPSCEAMCLKITSIASGTRSKNKKKKSLVFSTGEPKCQNVQRIKSPKMTLWVKCQILSRRL